MSKWIKKKAVRIIRGPAQDFTQFGEAVLPPKGIRYCGEEFKDDSYFFDSCKAEASRLVEHFGMDPDTYILDVGCGVGRLAIGVLHKIESMNCFWGVDISKHSIEWCQKHITSKNAHFKFQKLDVYNARYNPEGKILDASYSFPFSDNMFDIIYLYSVFSHMIDEDAKIYLKEFQRVLKPSGKIFLTAFVEEGVEPMVINPENYKYDWQGELHCVRFDKDYLESLFSDAGFQIDKFEYETETNEQSAFYLSVHK